MLTTAGAARATASAKLRMTTVGRDAAAGVDFAGMAVFPRSAGFHQTTRNAAASPTTTALSKKLTSTRVFCNEYRPTSLKRQLLNLCIMRSQYSLGNTIDILLSLKGRGFLLQDGDVPPRGYCELH